MSRRARRLPVGEGTSGRATRHQVALAWLLERSGVILPIPGTSSVEHLEANAAAAEIDLTDGEMARLG